MAVKAVKKKTTKTSKSVVEDEVKVVPSEVSMPKWHETSEVADEDKLDPAEEKMLDNILKGVVIFILGWLGLSILLVIGGYFGMWK
jgi:hypothetical protein